MTVASDAATPPEQAVCLVRWPEEEALLERLRVERRPRLLLVPPTAPAPAVTACEEDWIRLPADDGDVRARAEALATRSTRHRPTPALSPDGRIAVEDRWVVLSGIEQRLVSVMLDRLGNVVDVGSLRSAAWPDRPASDGALRVHMTRLRQRLRQLGLELHNVRGRGYVLERTAPADA